MINFFLIVGAVLGVYLIAMTLLATYKEDTSVANVTWIGGILIATLFTLVWYKMYGTRQTIGAAFITLWALRLLFHFYRRYDENDPRFASWRQRKGLDALLFNAQYVFGVQAPLMVLMAIPGYLLTRMCQPGFIAIDIVGFWLFVVGFLWETWSDFELSRFLTKPDNVGHVLSRGLWHFSRHPNYFGEIIIWLGLALLAWRVPHGPLALIAPVTITVWLVYIAGIPWVEQVMGTNPEYQEYQRTTNKLLPWFSRKAKSV